MEYGRYDVKNFLVDQDGIRFDPGAEVVLSMRIGTLDSGWRYAKVIENIKVIPGRFDPVNLYPGDCD